MRNLLIALAALPLMVGVANAAQPLNDSQLDQVNAGSFILPGNLAIALAHAQTYGPNGITFTFTDAHASDHSASSFSASAAFVPTLLVW